MSKRGYGYELRVTGCEFRVTGWKYEEKNREMDVPKTTLSWAIKMVKIAYRSVKTRRKPLSDNKVNLQMELPAWQRKTKVIRTTKAQYCLPVRQALFTDGFANSNRGGALIWLENLSRKTTACC